MQRARKEKERVEEEREGDGFGELVFLFLEGGNNEGEASGDNIERRYLQVTGLNPKSSIRAVS